MGNMVEKRYCPVCKKMTTFICKDKASGWFCLVCGYRERYREKESVLHEAGNAA